MGNFGPIGSLILGGLFSGSGDFGGLVTLGGRTDNSCLMIGVLSLGSGEPVADRWWWWPSGGSWCGD